MRAYPVTALRVDPVLPGDGSELAARLNEALATTLVGVLRGRRNHFLARSSGSLHAVDMFLAQSNQDQAHADALAQRIGELGATPLFEPAGLLGRSHAALYDPGTEVRDMAREDLDATSATHAALTDLVRFVGTRDPATRRLLLGILEDDQVRGKQLTTLIAATRGK